MHIKTADVFPGQGSQYKGMARKIYGFEPRVYLTANQILERVTLDGFDLLGIDGSQSELNKTENTQPAVYVNSMAWYTHFRKQFRQRNGYEYSAAITSGHSLGILTAMTAAGMIPFEEGVRLVRKRGEYMGDITGGKIMVTYLTREDVRKGLVRQICDETGTYQTHCNSPQQVIIGGRTEDVLKAKDLIEKILEERKITKKPMLLMGETPFHTPLMEPAAEKFARELESIVFAEPRIPVISDTTGGYITPENARQILTMQIHSPIEWDHATKVMIYHNIAHFVEFGGAVPLSVLEKSPSGLMKSMMLPTFRDVRNIDKVVSEQKMNYPFLEVISPERMEFALEMLSPEEDIQMRWIGERAYIFYVPKKDAQDEATKQLLERLERTGTIGMILVRPVSKHPDYLDGLPGLSDDVRLPILVEAVGCETCAVIGFPDFGEIAAELNGIKKER